MESFHFKKNSPIPFPGELINRKWNSSVYFDRIQTKFFNKKKTQDTRFKFSYILFPGQESFFPINLFVL